MPNYRRYYVAGGTIFFTVVTHQRRAFLTDPLARQCLRDAVATVRREHPFEIAAWVLLPDHLHTIWPPPVQKIRAESKALLQDQIARLGASLSKALG